MSPSAPETCSASDDFEKNSLGRYGIQPYQFEPRVETVTFVEALEQCMGSSVEEDEDMEIEEKERNTCCKIQTGR